MAINLKPPAKQSFTETNPLQSFQNPVEDFLAPFKQQKTELEGKINQMTSGQAPKTMPQITNEDQERLLRDARYNSAMQDPNVSGITKFVWWMLHGIDNLTGWWITKWVQSMSASNALSEFDPNTLISWIKDVWGEIKNATNELGNFFQNKAPWLDQAKQQWRFITQEQLDKKIEKAIAEMPDATDEEIAQAIWQLKNEWYFFEWMNDKNSPTYEKVRDFVPLLWEATDLLWGTTKMWGQFVGWTLHWGATYSEWWVNLLEWDTNLWASKILSGITELGTSMLWWAFPIATSAFNTETVEPVVEATLWNVQKWVNYATNKGLDLTWMDPNSEEYKNYSNALTTIWTILTTMGVVKWAQIGFKKTFGENLTYENAKVSDFVKNTGKTAEDLQNAINQIRPNADIKITDSTPISKVFTPAEFAQMQAMARNAWASWVWRKEWFISDAMQTKIREKVAEYAGKIWETIKQSIGAIKNKQTTEKWQPLPKNEGNAITSDWHVYTMENTSWIIQRAYKWIFTNGTDVDLAMRAFNPSVQWLTQSQKMDIWNTMLEWAKTLHNEQVKGNITVDVSTMEGAMEWIQQAKELHGWIIWEVTWIDWKFSMDSEIKALQDWLEKRWATISPDLNNLAKNILEDFATYWPEITIAEAQRLMSTIKSVVFSDPVKIKQLSGTISWSALDSFLKAFEAKFESAIESSSGRFPELQASRNIYRQMKQIEKSLANSLIIEARNQAKKWGLSNTVWNIAALAEIARNPSLSAMASAAMIKIIASEIGKWKTRNAAFERLMENFKVADIKRAKGKISYEKKEQPKRNKFNEDMKKQENKMLLPKPSGKATWAKNFRVNQSFEKNPEPNISWKQEGSRPMRSEEKQTKRLLPAPRTPKWTTLPRNDIVAESMRWVNSQRPGTKKEIIPRWNKSQKDLTSQEESSKIDSPSKNTTMSEQDLLDKMNSEYFDSLKDPADKNLMTAELSKGTPLYEIIAKIENLQEKDLPRYIWKSVKQEVLVKDAKKMTEEAFIKKYAQNADEYIPWIEAKYTSIWTKKIQQLKPNEYSSFDEVKWSKSSEEYIWRLVSFLKKNPQKNLEPVLIEGWHVLDGHHRVQAYIEAGRSEIPYMLSERDLSMLYKETKKQVIPKKK